MGKRTVLYRGSLKNCNYSCSYCPFAKHRALNAELEKDRRNFLRFCDSIEKRAQAFSIGAVFVTPYGEATIHRWYWEGLSRLADLSEIDRVGIQTNLSFSVEECLKIFDSLREKEPVENRCPEQKREKLSIWATFHPEMTTVDAFIARCHSLMQKHVRVCAGAVGVPENIPLIRKLRERLSPEIYLWINRMDGLKRNYRQEEIAFFREIDPLFQCELAYPETNGRMCVDRCFVEADGRVRSCNISKCKRIDWYDSGEEEIFAPVCNGKRCSCYLSYGGRSDFGLRNIFGEYPVFRIPRRFQAVFFDLEGTLLPAKKEADAAVCNGTGPVGEATLRASAGKAEAMHEVMELPKGKTDSASEMTGTLCGTLHFRDSGGLPPEEGHGRGLPDRVRRKLNAVREICPVFLATSMPESEVIRRLGADMALFQGFVFASGGYVCLKNGEGGREKVAPIDRNRLSSAMEYGRKVKARCMVSEKDGTAYKLTLVKGHHSRWTDRECAEMAELLKDSDCRFFTEKHCLEIISRDRDKGVGIREICGCLGISTKDVLAVGNDEEDAAMERVCGGYIKLGS